MPPKGAAGAARPQHTRKPSGVNTGPDRDHVSAKEKGKGKEKDMEKEKNKKDAKDSDIMPPPPPPPKPFAILEPELGALEDSLKNITITTAQIFRFYAETKKLGVQKQAPRPPRTMTSTLEQELGRYDQICDTLDAHLTRAIAILRRDLEREDKRHREEEAEKARAKAAEASTVDADVEMTTAPGPSSESEAKPQQVLPSGALAGTGKLPHRRPSKISLSTLHRSPFPLKLDLSSTSLRLGLDDGGLNLSALDNLNALSALGSMGVDGISGLASPVTLAPKSARPMAPGELPPDVLAALASASGVESQNMQLPDPSQHVDIDLTLEDDLHIPANITLLNAGNSADKPIELDLDLDVHMSDLPSDIFGEQTGDGTQQADSSTDADMETLFGPETADASTANSGDAASGMDMSMLLAEDHGHEDALFAPLNPENNEPGEAASAIQPGADAVKDEGSGDNGGFDYSLFFNEATNQEQFDMMEHFLKMDNAGTAAEASEPNSNPAPMP